MTPEPIESTPSQPAACAHCGSIGACLAFFGIEGAVPLLHGPAACAFGIRQFLSGHFKEPLAAAISGDAGDLSPGAFLRVWDDVLERQQPTLIGIIGTCPGQTGEWLAQSLREASRRQPSPAMTDWVALTPHAGASLAEGFDSAVRHVVEALADDRPAPGRINLIPGLVSPADLHYLKEIFGEYQLPLTLLPDYSDTLDGPIWTSCDRMPAGGTPLGEVRAMGRARATLEFGGGPGPSAGHLLAERFGVPSYRLPLPVGLRHTDHFYTILQQMSGRPRPARHQLERDRLLDAIARHRRLLDGQRVALYGEVDLVAGMAALVLELGLRPVLCATARPASGLPALLEALGVAHGQPPQPTQQPLILEGADGPSWAAAIEHLQPALQLGAPGDAPASGPAALIQIGFPVLDRVGGPRLLHLGYRGARQLLDRMVDAISCAAPPRWHGATHAYPGAA